MNLENIKFYQFLFSSKTLIIFLILSFIFSFNSLIFFNFKRAEHELALESFYAK